MQPKNAVRTMLTALFAVTIMLPVAAFARSGGGDDGGGDDNGGGGGNGDELRLKASLFGANPMHGHVDYREIAHGNNLEVRFKVEVEHGAPGQHLNIEINGQFIDTITLNSVGKIEFKLRTAEFIDDPGDGQPLPADFPALASGDVVTVGPLSGVLFATIVNGSDDVPVQKYRVDACMDSGPMEINVKYTERLKNGQFERRFVVEVENGTLGQKMKIKINGVLVGTVKITDEDQTEFELRTAAFIDSPDDGLPMPASFPSILAGDQIKVGTLSDTFEPH